MKILKKIFNKGSKQVPVMKAVDALEGFNTLINAYKDNHRVTEEQRTARENIRATRDISIENIKAQKEVMLDYFNQVFSERRYLYQEFFDKLDKGIETNNIELIQTMASSIVTVAMDSPLKDLQRFNNQNELGSEVKKIDNFTL